MQSETKPVCYIRLSEACRRIGVSKRYIQRRIETGELRAYRPSSKLTLLRVEDVDQLVEASLVQPRLAVAQTA